ncbi:Nitroreductase family protein [Balamuthia mandrillaris]
MKLEVEWKVDQAALLVASLAVLIAVVFLVLPRVFWTSKTNHRLPVKHRNRKEAEEEEGQETEADQEEEEVLNHEKEHAPKTSSVRPFVKGEEEASHVPFVHERLSEQEAIQRSQQFYELMNKRRSVRMFSKESVPFEVIENAILTAGTAPSGAHKQPWTFVVVKDAMVKRQIREAAEREEKYNYEKRMSKTWLKDISHLGTNWKKPHLTDAPYVIVVFKQQWGALEDGSKDVHYYQEKSVGIAVGMLITALHNAGLVTL